MRAQCKSIPITACPLPTGPHLDAFNLAKRICNFWFGRLPLAEEDKVGHADSSVILDPEPDLPQGVRCSGDKSQLHRQHQANCSLRLSKRNVSAGRLQSKAGAHDTACRLHGAPLQSPARARGGGGGMHMVDQLGMTRSVFQVWTGVVTPVVCPGKLQVDNDMMYMARAHVAQSDMG